MKKILIGFLVLCILSILIIGVIANITCSDIPKHRSDGLNIVTSTREKQEGGTYNYQRVNLTLLPTRDAGMGGRPDWSFDGEWIAYDHKEGDGYWDIYRVHPDSSGEECLTCNHPELPNRHMGNPAFSPDGHWLVMTVEQESHPGGSTIALPGAGGYNDLWVMDLYSDSPSYDVYLIHSVNDGFPAGGSLHPVFSHDGTKLFWSDRTGSGGEFGDWRLVIADFITAPSPHLENYQFYEPGDRDQWYESHGWGLDDSWIYFTGSPLTGMDDECMDICRMDFSDPNNVERLTWTSGINGEDCEWDEHAHMNPRGDIMCWSSSMPHGYSERDSHQSDIWIMNLDGSGKRQVTFFNDPDPPNSSWDEYDSGGRRCSDKAWNPDGTKLVFFSFDSGTGEHYYEDDQYLYILEFFINESGNQPPNKPAKPSGETNCKIGTEYEYTFTTTDSDGDNVYYCIEWEDDIVDDMGWIGPYESGEEITVNHTWSKRGNYNIKAKAKDIYDAEGEWSDPLPITTPKNKQSLNWLHLRFLDKIMERFPLLEQQLRSVLMYWGET